MNPIEQLRALEATATPGPWETKIIQDADDGSWSPFPPCHDPEDFWEDCDEDQADSLAQASAVKDCELIDALRNLAPELLDLWEAVQDQRDNGNTNDLRPDLFPALAALNAKAAGVLHGLA